MYNIEKSVQSEKEHNMCSNILYIVEFRDHVQLWQDGEGL